MATKQTKKNIATEVFSFIGVLSTAAIGGYLLFSSLWFLDDVIRTKNLVLNGDQRNGVMSIEKLSDRMDRVVSRLENDYDTNRQLRMKVDCLTVKGTWTWDDHSDGFICKK